MVFNTAMTGYQKSSPTLVRAPDRHAHLPATSATPVATPRTWSPARPTPPGKSSWTITFRLQQWRAQRSLPEFMRRHKLVGVAGLDTRRLTPACAKGARRTVHPPGRKGRQAGQESGAEGGARVPGLKGMDLAKGRDHQGPPRMERRAVGARRRLPQEYSRAVRRWDQARPRSGTDR